MKHYSERVVRYKSPYDIYDPDSGIPHPNDKKNYVIKNHSHNDRFIEAYSTRDLLSVIRIYLWFYNRDGHRIDHT